MGKTKYTEEFVKDELAKEGWELLSNYKHSNDYLFIRNINQFDGHVCKFRFSRWLQGPRPDMKSIVDKHSYVKSQIENEGWILTNAYTSNMDPLYIYNKEYFDGSLCKFDWSSWNQGIRPNFLSIIDKTKYVKESFEKEGWILLDEYELSTKKLRIKHPVKRDGFICTTTWADWSCGGYRPDFRSIVDQTAYVKNRLNNLGYDVVDNDWYFKSRAEYFRIRSYKTDRTYSISYNKIDQHDMPESPKRLIMDGIKRHLTRKDRKTYPLANLFEPDYWVKLEEKFPILQDGYHIDHIVPISWWGTSWEQIKLANDPSNLRLLDGFSNRSRNNRLKASDLDEYDLWDLYYQAENPDGYKLIEDCHDLAS
jgi:hypothetical protein